MRPHTTTARVDAELFVLAAVLHRAWSAPSAWEPQRWRAAAPDEGQCAATALVTQDVVGGVLRVGRLHLGSHLVSHCWNTLPDGREVDLTSRQLRGAVPEAVRSIARRDLVAVPGVLVRYGFLAARVARLLRLEGISVSAGNGAGR